MALGGPKEQQQTLVLAPAIVNEADASELILIGAGKFLRGSLQGQGDPDERPQTEVDLDAFYMAKYPVTNKQYRKFLAKTGHREPRYWKDPQFTQDDQPVVGVSWDDAVAYCNWAGLRLPTEAEWEKAAGWDEAQKLKRWWPWGDGDPTPERASYANQTPVPPRVGSYPAGVSAYGCHDMAGGVLEWCNDWYLYNYYNQAPASNPPGPGQQPYKVCRGGSYKRPTSYITTSYRYWYSTTYCDDETGFRCAKSV